jgi:AraC-like DNA-binding protein
MRVIKTTRRLGARIMLELRLTEDEFQGLLEKIQIEFNEKGISILRDFYVEGMQRKEVSEQRGVSRSYVSRMLNRFLDAISELPEDEIRDISVVLEDTRLTLTGKLKHYGRQN